MASLKVQPGDVIPIPCKLGQDLGFVISRVIGRSKVNVIEVFSDFHAETCDPYAVMEKQSMDPSERLFSPVYASFDFSKYFGKVKWPVLGSVGTHAEWERLLGEVEFAEAAYQESGRYVRGGVRLKETSDERRSLEPGTIYSNPQLIHRINLHLAGRLDRCEALTSKRLAELMAEEPSGWLEVELDKCLLIADEVAIKLRTYTKRSGRSASN